MGNLENGTKIIYEPEPGEPCWPFWGLLEAVTVPPTLRLSLGQSGIRFKKIPSDFFARSEPIGRQALRLLQRRTIGELRVAATEIRAAIAHAVVESTDIAIYDLITRPCINGGAQLHIELDDAPLTAREISDLLESWATKWDDPTGLPNRDGLSDLDALRWFGRRQYGEKLWYGLIEPDESEIYAVLALMLICAAVHVSQLYKDCSVPNPADPTVWQLKVFGWATINAVEAIAYAERLESEQEIRQDHDRKQETSLDDALSQKTSERAIHAATKRHAPSNAARDWVRQEWALHHDSYSGNKSEFSRTYVARVKNEFQDSKGDPLIVTEKTIRDVWLKSPPAAGK
jgi:hypothetical protein